MLTGCLGQSEHLSEFTGDVDAGPAAVVFRNEEKTPSAHSETPVRRAHWVTVTHLFKQPIKSCTYSAQCKLHSPVCTAM
ncbi:hypothetical protein EB796_011385 [Bugula neritina]|uniref:Uncharacterized protein n=1 Tax=Bugula neritina TaxID=10212 RepID=A0A7J7JWR1_BUGNE|nr:hypothetical protein EB796_011385 [Bugula neritina]